MLDIFAGYAVGVVIAATVSLVTSPAAFRAVRPKARASSSIAVDR
ncbi:MAG TPA: hypothetical protein VHY10_20055 [Xanthobacteraceae bacterium]|jgi:gas vesicle protein|nr:hypothetical protein [Xanthobacteraceae bacterium]